MPKALKSRYRLALIACAVLAVLSITLLAVLWMRKDAPAPAPMPQADARSQCAVPTCAEPPRPSPPARSKQANWDYKPSDNPRYEQNTQIQQIGFLTSATAQADPSGASEPKILPLFGYSLREKHSDRWVYFTATDQQQSIRLPVESEGRDCMNDDIGCREVFTGDEIKVRALNDQPFTLTLYKNQFP